MEQQLWLACLHIDTEQVGPSSKTQLVRGKTYKWIENGLPDCGKREITKANPDKDNVGDKDKNTKVDSLLPLPLFLSLLDQVGLHGLAKTPGQDAVQEVPPEVEVVLTPQPHLTMLMLVTMTKMVMVVGMTTTNTFVIMVRFPQNDDYVDDDDNSDDIEVVFTRPAAVDDDSNDDNIDDNNDGD